MSTAAERVRARPRSAPRGGPLQPVLRARAASLPAPAACGAGPFEVGEVRAGALIADLGSRRRTRCSFLARRVAPSSNWEQRAGSRTRETGSARPLWGWDFLDPLLRGLPRGEAPRGLPQESTRAGGSAPRAPRPGPSAGRCRLQSALRGGGPRGSFAFQGAEPARRLPGAGAADICQTCEVPAAPRRALISPGCPL